MATIISFDIPKYDVGSEEYEQWWKRLLRMSQRYDQANERAQRRTLTARKRHHRKHRAAMRRKQRGFS